MKQKKHLNRWHSSILLCLLIPTILLLMSSDSNAQSNSTNPRIISYQGSITDTYGSPLDGDHRIVISLYSDRDGNATVWKGAYNESIRSGIFTVLIGSGDYPLPQRMDFSKPLWVGIQIDNSAEMKPYIQLTGAPYAVSVSDKSITKDKMATDYIGTISINGKKINGVGTPINLKDGTNSFLLYDQETNSISINSLNGFENGKPQWVATNPCASNLNNDGGITTNTISGGCGNTTTTPNYATISGGLNNRAFGDYSVVGGGDTNFASGHHSTIGGGYWSSASGVYATVAGGDQNNASGSHSTIGGGNLHTASGADATIGGGTSNSATAAGAVVAGGYTNQATANQSAILGGNGNQATGVLATVCGGDANVAVSPDAFVGGGRHNFVKFDKGTIAGGETNLIVFGSNHGGILSWR